MQSGGFISNTNGDQIVYSNQVDQFTDNYAVNTENTDRLDNILNSKMMSSTPDIV